MNHVSSGPQADLVPSGPQPVYCKNYKHTSLTVISIPMVTVWQALFLFSDWRMKGLDLIQFFGFGLVLDTWSRFSVSGWLFEPPNFFPPSHIFGLIISSLGTASVFKTSINVLTRIIIVTSLSPCGLVEIAPSSVSSEFESRQGQRMQVEFSI